MATNSEIRFLTPLSIDTDKRKKYCRFKKFGIKKMNGTHGIGHTRMATESAVTTLGAHPFNTGSDQCLVHNGSLSNHNQLRKKLQRNGMEIQTENDTEVARKKIDEMCKKLLVNLIIEDYAIKKWKIIKAILRVSFV